VIALPRVPLPLAQAEIVQIRGIVREPLAGRHVLRSGELRSTLRWDIAAIAPIRTINM
jgi:hypothetical protein